MEQEFINPQFQQMYDWSFKDEGNFVEVSISFQKDFNTDIIKIELNDSKNAVCVDFLEEVPIICGTLYQSVEKFETIILDEKYIIKFFKDPSTTWKHLISKEHPDNGKIDPCSSFTLFFYYTEQYKIVEEENAGLSQKYLENAIGCGFVKALLWCTEQMENDPESQEAYKTMMNLIAFKYGHPVGIFKMGVIFSKEGNQEEALKMFSLAGRAGIGIAYPLIGQILSPLSSIKYDKKDPEAALEIFEAVIKNKEEPISLHEAAKLYNSGVGCKRDTVKANEYNARAKSIRPDFPDLPLPKIGIGHIFSIGAVVIAGASLAYSAYRKFARK